MRIFHRGFWHLLWPKSMVKVRVFQLRNPMDLLRTHWLRSIGFSLCRILLRADKFALGTRTDSQPPPCCRDAIPSRDINPADKYPQVVISYNNFKGCTDTPSPASTGRTRTALDVSVHSKSLRYLTYPSFSRSATGIKRRDAELMQ